MKNLQVRALIGILTCSMMLTMAAPAAAADEVTGSSVETQQENENADTEEPPTPDPAPSDDFENVVVTPTADPEAPADEKDGNDPAVPVPGTTETPSGADTPAATETPGAEKPEVTEAPAADKNNRKDSQKGDAGSEKKADNSPKNDSDKKAEDKKEEEKKEDSLTEKKEEESDKEKDTLVGNVDPASGTVNNATDLPDGVYTNGALTFTGGTGKVKYELDQIRITDGKAFATFHTTSSYTHFYTGRIPKKGEPDYNPSEIPSLYDPNTGSTGVNVYAGNKVEIPVQLNGVTPVAGRTVGMNDPHWILYEFQVKLSVDYNVKAVQAVDSENNSAIGNALCTVTDESGNAVAVRGDGKYHLLSGKTYTVQAAADGYNSNSQTFTANSNDTVSVALVKNAEPEKFFTYAPVIKDEATGKLIENAVVRITDSSNVTLNAENGKYSLSSRRVYDLTVSADNYETKTSSVQLTADESPVIKLKHAVRKVRITVDCGSEKPTIKVTDAKGKVLKAGTDGLYEIPTGQLCMFSITAKGYSSSNIQYPIEDAGGKGLNLTVKMTKQKSTEPTAAPTKTPTAAPTKAPTAAPADAKVDVVNDGDYTMSYKDAENKMFNMAGVVLHVKDGVYTADITLSGTGYDYVYPGSAEQAKAAGEGAWSPAWTNADGKYTYTIRVPYLDKPFTLASRSHKYATDGSGNEPWRDGDHSIIIYSKDVNGSALPTHKAEDKNSSSYTQDPNPSKQDGVHTGDANGDNGNSQGSDTGDSSGKSSGRTGSGGSGSGGYSANTNGSTGAVNSSTKLEDGEYTPDSFNWSGGTGRVSISCNRIIVQGGKTYADITFSSTHFQYVKAGGMTINDKVQGGGSTTFRIPVQLNQNNTIIGMTTAMSQPHEITYTLYFGLKAAEKAGGSNGGGGSSKGGSAAKTSEKPVSVDKQYDTFDAVAPDIPGLEAEKETEVTYSSLFKIFNYKDGYSLIEIDMEKGTALKTIDKKTLEKKSEDTGEEEEKESSATITAQKDALYKNPILKYLVIPEGKEIPAGMDRQVILIQTPADKACVASEEALSYMEDLDLLKMITAAAVEKDKLPKELADKDDLKDAGSYDQLNYKALILGKNNLMIQNSDLLPEEKEIKEAATEAAKVLYSLGSRCVQMEMPLLVDRSADEENDLAKAEWYKVYGTIYGTMDKAGQKYSEIVSKASDSDKAAALKAAGKEENKAGDSDKAGNEEEK
ncbi:MAG: hypothetical protein Q4B22_05165 [Eubacteriales bacterium]|nr:hypothetical protein [Eubacteriales bacterium]